ncbi:MAG: glycoside hydrolase family 3 C-terminal domain-containing protein [Eubacterium sp.]|nr:glycoside hydrolase family 3 C-terminal domain-containing protein [Eubacterium sp.]
MDVEAIVKKMTLEEKASAVEGKLFWFTQEYPELGIPSVQVSDGPHGLRKMYGQGLTITSVCFPAACATACSFDTELMENMGHTLGRECQAEDVAVILGPAVNIKRSPLCGRNFEYVSEDPYVAGKMSAALIRGVQAENVGTSIKHFAANNQEFERMYGSSEVDERTLREIYFPAFEIAVKEAQPWTVMCSYNRINGTYSSENPWLLNDVLRKDWGFDGLVMSDWGAVSDRIAGIAAGLDLDMPGSQGVNNESIVKAVQEGRLSEEALDTAVLNILKMVDKYVSHRSAAEIPAFDLAADSAQAADVARECIVLLKNEDKVLPLAKEEKVALIGGFAEKPRYQGGGSSHIESFKVVSALSVAQRYGAFSFNRGFSEKEDIYEKDLQQEALAAAAEADKIVVFAGLPDLFESEGYDREHMQLPACQNRLIADLVKTGKPVIVVLHNGSPVEMPWADDVAGIVEAYLGGDGVGEAVMDVLYGRVNPSGRLAESFPMKLSDNPSYLNFPGTGHKVNYAEGVFVGYRYYDTKQMPVRFPFGYGLSYTDFRYANLRVSRDSFTAAEGVTVSVDVTNIGDRAGKEVVQLYVSDKTGSTIRPVHELKGFCKLALEPGETKTATFTLDKRAFAWYDVEQGDWYAANGTYVIEVGRSSRQIEYTAEVHIIGSKEKPPVITPDVQVGELLKSPFTREFTQERLKKYTDVFKGLGNETDEMVEAVVRFMPLRALRSFLGVSNEEVDAICEELKAHIAEQMK